MDQLPTRGGVVCLCFCRDSHIDFGDSIPPWSAFYRILVLGLHCVVIFCQAAWEYWPVRVVVGRWCSFDEGGLNNEILQVVLLRSGNLNSRKQMAGACLCNMATEALPSDRKWLFGAISACLWVFGSLGRCLFVHHFFSGWSDERPGGFAEHHDVRTWGELRDTHQGGTFSLYIHSPSIR